MNGPLAITYNSSRDQLAFASDEYSLRSRCFDSIIWLRPPTVEQRDMAQTRLRMYAAECEMFASRAPLPQAAWDSSPLLTNVATECEHHGLNSTWVLRSILTIQQRFTTAGHANAAREVAQHNIPGQDQRFADGEEAGKGTVVRNCPRLSTWLATQVIAVLPMEDVNEILAACIARQLNPVQ